MPAISLYMLVMVGCLFSCSQKKADVENQRTQSHGVEIGASTPVASKPYLVGDIGSTIAPASDSMPPDLSGTVLTEIGDGISNVNSQIQNTNSAPQTFNALSPLDSTGTNGSIVFSMIASKEAKAPTGSNLKGILENWNEPDDLLHIQPQVQLSYVGMHLDNVRFTPTLANLSTLEIQSATKDKSDWQQNFKTLLPNVGWNSHFTPVAILTDFFAGKKMSYATAGDYIKKDWSLITQKEWTSISTVDINGEPKVHDQANAYFTTELIPRCNPSLDEATWQTFYQKQKLGLAYSVLSDLRVKPIGSVLEPLTSALGCTTPAVVVQDGTYHSLGFTVGMEWDTLKSNVYCRSFVLIGTYTYTYPDVALPVPVKIPFMVESYTPLYGAIALPQAGIRILPNQTQYAYLRTDPSQWFADVDWSHVMVEMHGSYPLFVLFDEFENADQFAKIQTAIAKSFSYTGLSSSTDPFGNESGGASASTVATASVNPLPGMGYAFNTNDSATIQEMGSPGYTVPYYLPTRGPTTGTFRFSLTAPTSTLNKWGLLQWSTPKDGLWVDYRNNNNLLKYSDKRMANFWFETTSDSTGNAILGMQLDGLLSPPVYLTQTSAGTFQFSNTATPVGIQLWTKAPASPGRPDVVATGFLRTFSGCILQVSDPVISEPAPAPATATTLQSLTCWDPTKSASPIPFQVFSSDPCRETLTSFSKYYVQLWASTSGMPSPFPEFAGCSQSAAGSLWSLFTVQNTTSSPLVFSLDFSGVEAVLIQAGSTFSWKVSNAPLMTKGYPAFDNGASSQTGIYINGLYSGYSLRGGFSSIASPIPLTISTNPDGSWKFTSTATIDAVQPPP